MKTTRHFPITSFSVIGIFIALWTTVVVGWALNIYDIVVTVGGPFTALLAARIAGVFVLPLGVALGLFS